MDDVAGAVAIVARPVTILSAAVRDHRRAALLRIMDGQGLDALVLSGADWFEFAANHAIAVQGWERPYAMVLARDGRSAALLHDLSAAKIGIARERGRLWLERAVFYSEVPQVAGSRPLLTQWTQTFAEILASLGLARAKIGVDASPGFVAKLPEVLPGATLVALGARLRPARWVKHPEEIAVMREAARISDWAIARYREEIRPGRLLQEMDYSIAAQTCAEAARRFPGEDFQILRFMTLSGAAAAAAHGDGCAAGAVANAGTMLVATCNVRLNGLSMENQCTFAIGTVDARVRELMQVALAANRAGLEAAVAGRPVAGIDRAAHDVIVAAGFGAYVTHRTGHGIGVGTHEFPEDMCFNTRALIENEVYMVEPGLYLPGYGGFRYVDGVVVGDRPEQLTRAPKDFDSMWIQ